MSMVISSGTKKKGIYDAKRSSCCSGVIEMILLASVSGDVRGVASTTATQGNVVVAVEAAYTRSKT
jgi:hypothetical protein